MNTSKTSKCEAFRFLISCEIVNEGLYLFLKAKTVSLHLPWWRSVRSFRNGNPESDSVVQILFAWLNEPNPTGVLWIMLKTPEIFSLFQALGQWGRSKSERATSGISGERDPGEKGGGRESLSWPLLFPYQTPAANRPRLHCQRAWNRLGNFGQNSNGKVCFGFFRTCLRTHFRPEYSWSPLEVVLLFRLELACVAKRFRGV